MGTVLQLLSTAQTLYDPSQKHRSTEKQPKKIRHNPGELPRDYLIRSRKKFIQLEDAAIISGTQSDYYIVGSVTEQIKRTSNAKDEQRV